MSDSPDIRVLVADDQATVRDGLATILEYSPGVSVVGTAENGERAVELARETRPDVVLMDLRMPVLDGAAATRQIRAELPDTAVLVLTTYADDSSIAGALAAGAAGYLTKSAGREQILAALNATVAGQQTFAPEVAAVMIRGLGQRSARQTLAREAGLTERESDVLERMGQGASNREIAEAMFVSLSTVKTHTNNLFAKLGVSSRAEAIARLGESG
ncbi:DNA-binding response regulator [Mycetocola tolaasinivorans]|uniref:DNA-binding response regulator n=1 Tax=Mycetocola tolaasinivorans TaxID=76635 RepID=A0A3L7ACZ9_9MICO|nr:response regulator transcription factor [Mycetocola tolaasinivorans]RLP77531.1 DNA-binding response regulator [Mycetocola tolaasinivorans]